MLRIMVGSADTAVSFVPGNVLASGVTATQTGDKQVIKLGFQNGNYYPDVIRVQKGVPVEMQVDLAKVTGCMTTIVSDGLGIKKRVGPGDNIISFTPTEAGAFPFTCGMGMGRGVIIVEDASGECNLR
jgi:plastocyanin domain-containing protein